MGLLGSFMSANDTCLYQNVSYSHRVDDPGMAYTGQGWLVECSDKDLDKDQEKYNWCVVPDTGYDAVLFACIALLAACILQGKFSALWILLAGAFCQVLALVWNLRQFGNALAIWLGITPADLFLYIFLPPMLLDSAVRLPYFHFQKMLLHVISFAFLMVLASTALMVPVLLYVFGLRSQGWFWQHAALFSAMIASTDAVAVGAILKSSGEAPEHMILLMEGESLFNDATAIVLFEIFFDMVRDLGDTAPTGQETVHELLKVGWKIVWLAFGGFVIGILFGWLTRQILKIIKRSGHKAPEQLSLSVAMAYLTFYIANGPAEVSGVIAVVVFGLYGSATATWGMSSFITETHVFDTFWDTVSFALNGIVFFYAGASSVNFFWRSSEELYKSEGNWQALAVTCWRLPLLWLSMFCVRGLCILLLNPVFSLSGSKLSPGEIVFATIGGLRGAISLILAQMVVTEQNPDPNNPKQQRVTAQLALWTAGIVVLTLVINAPLIPKLIEWTGLAEISPVKARIRAKAVRALERYAQAAIHDLQHDEDEMLRGVDWKRVQEEVHMTKQLEHFAPKPKPKQQPKRVPRRGVWRLVHWLCCCCGVDRVEDSVLIQPLLPDRADSSQSDDQHDNSQHASGMQRAATLQDQATIIWEAAEDDEEHDAIASAGTTASGPLVKMQRGLTAKGRVIGKVESRKGQPNLLERPSIVSEDLPFTRTARDRGQQEAEKDAHYVVNMDRADSLWHGQPGAESSFRPAAEAVSQHSLPEEVGQTRLPPIRTQTPPPQLYAAGREDEETQEGKSANGKITLSNGTDTVLQSIPSDRPPPPTPFTPEMEPQPSEILEPFNMKLPWEPELLPGDGQDAGPVRPTTPPIFQGHLRRDSKGNTYIVIPQPVLQPKMYRPDEEPETVEQPSMRWMTVDFMRLQRNNQRDESRAESQPTPHPMHATQHSQTTTRMLRRTLSGPLVRSGTQEVLEPLPVFQDDQPEVQEEARVRLVAGLKRYFHDKRAEGLLSANGMRMLDYACDAQMDNARQPLAMWEMIEREVCGHLKVRVLSRLLFLLRRFGVSLRSWRPRVLVHFFIHAPNRKVARVVASRLSNVMLLALEVAVEFWLALKWSPQAQWLAESDAATPLQKEAKQQIQQVWKFIIDREIESPARFQAIQTYRAAMAILRQQQRFIGQLYSSGMVDASERDLMLAPVQRRERLLQRRGAVWRAPSITEVLRTLPFLADLPTPFFDMVLSHGLLLKYDKNDVIWAPPTSSDAEQEDADNVMPAGAPCEGSGIFIVIAGLVSRSFKHVNGKSEEFFMGSGGVFGLTSALVGESLPGSGPAVAVGNALEQGPVLFHWPQTFIEELRERAAMGIPDWVQLRTDLFRVAALFLVERLKDEVMAAAIAHYQALALHKTRRRALRRLQRKFEGKLTKGKGTDVWQRVCKMEAAQKVVEKTFSAALEATGPDIDDPESDPEETEAAALELTEVKSLAAGSSEQPGSKGFTMTDQDIMNCVDPQKTWKKVRKHAADALAALKEAVRDGDLVELGPNEVIEHCSSIILLCGSLHTSGKASYLPARPTRPSRSASQTPPPQSSPQASTISDVPTGPDGTPEGADAVGAWVGWQEQEPGKKGQRWEVAVAYKGPCVLPWLWEDVTHGGDVLLRAQAIPFRAGPEGATLVVCLPDSAEETSMGSPTSGEHEERAASVFNSLHRDSMARHRESPTTSTLAAPTQAYGMTSASGGRPRRRRMPVGGDAEAPEAIETDSPGNNERRQLRVTSITRLK